MVPGKEVTLMTQAAVLKVNKSTGANQPQLTVSSDAHLVADIESFRKIYDYYGGKKTLHQILFAQDEASIALPDAGKKEDYSFSVSGVEPKADRYIKSKGGHRAQSVLHARCLGKDEAQPEKLLQLRQQPRLKNREILRHHAARRLRKTILRGLKRFCPSASGARSHRAGPA